MRNKIALIGLAIAAFYVVRALLFPSTVALDSSPDRSDACFMSQKFVRQNLKAPSSAEFPLWSEANCKATRSGDTWKVRSYVDSQNSFGAMIRSDYGVEMRYHADRDIWTLLDIAIVSP